MEKKKEKKQNREMIRHTVKMAFHVFSHSTLVFQIKNKTKIAYLIYIINERQTHKTK